MFKAFQSISKQFKFTTLLGAKLFIHQSGCMNPSLIVNDISASQNEQIQYKSPEIVAATSMKVDDFELLPHPSQEKQIR
jgi:hypothetical protein